MSYDLASTQPYSTLYHHHHYPSHPVDAGSSHDCSTQPLCASSRHPTWQQSFLALSQLGLASIILYLVFDRLSTVRVRSPTTYINRDGSQFIRTDPQGHTPNGDEGALYVSKRGQHRKDHVLHITKNSQQKLTEDSSGQGAGGNHGSGTQFDVRDNLVGTDAWRSHSETMVFDRDGNASQVVHGGQQNVLGDGDVESQDSSQTDTTHSFSASERSSQGLDPVLSSTAEQKAAFVEQLLQQEQSTKMPSRLDPPLPRLAQIPSVHDDSEYADVVYGKAAGQPLEFFRYIDKPPRPRDAVSSAWDSIRTHVPLYESPTHPRVLTAAATQLHNTLVAALKLSVIHREPGEAPPTASLLEAWNPSCIVGWLSAVQHALVRFVLVEATNMAWPFPGPGDGLRQLWDRRCQLNKRTGEPRDVGLNTGLPGNVSLETGVQHVNWDTTGRILLTCRKVGVLLDLLKQFTTAACRASAAQGEFRMPEYIAAALQLAIVQHGTGVHAVRTRYGFSPEAALHPVPDAENSVESVQATCTAAKKLLSPTELDDVAQLVRQVAPVFTSKVGQLVVGTQSSINGNSDSTQPYNVNKDQTNMTVGYEARQNSMWWPQDTDLLVTATDEWRFLEGQLQRAVGTCLTALLGGAEQDVARYDEWSVKGDVSSQGEQQITGGIDTGTESGKDGSRLRDENGAGRDRDAQVDTDSVYYYQGFEGAADVHQKTSSEEISSAVNREAVVVEDQVGESSTRNQRQSQHVAQATHRMAQTTRKMSETLDSVSQSPQHVSLDQHHMRQNAQQPQATAHRAASTFRRDGSSLATQEVTSLVLSILRLQLQLHALPLSGTLPPNARTEVLISNGTRAWTRPEAALKADIAAQGYLVSPFLRDNPAVDATTGQPAVLSRGVRELLTWLSPSLLMKFSQLPPPLQHRLYNLGYVGVMTQQSAQSWVVDAEEAWKRRRFFEMPHALVIGPPKTGTTGFMECARSKLFDPTAVRVIQAPRDSLYMGRPVISLNEFDSFRGSFLGLRRHDILRDTTGKLGSHVVYASKEPLWYARPRDIGTAYLQVHDPTHVRLITSVRDPVDRTVSCISMFNSLWPEAKTPYQQLSSVLELALPMQHCMAVTLCKYCGPKIRPGGCKVEGPAPECNHADVTATFSSYVARPTRKAFDMLPINVVIKVLECGQFLQQDMPALQLRKWLALFGSGQLQVLKYSTVRAFNTWQMAVLVSNATGTYLGRHEVFGVKYVQDREQKKEAPARSVHKELPKDMIDSWNAAKMCTNIGRMGNFTFDRGAHVGELQQLRELLMPYVEMMESLILEFEL